eukprot:1152561-Pelagomonas_calceolata.AAC.2
MPAAPPALWVQHDEKERRLLPAVERPAILAHTNTLTNCPPFSPRFVCLCVCSQDGLPHCWPGVPAHSASAQHQRRWQAQGHVRHDRHPGYWAPLLQRGVQEGRGGHEEARWCVYVPTELPGAERGRVMQAGGLVSAGGLSRAGTRTEQGFIA